MNRWGIMVDVSHPSKGSMMQAVALSKAPIIASHSGVRALADHSRNMDDEQLMAIKQNGGVVQTVAFARYVKADPPRTRGCAAAANGGSSARAVSGCAAAAERRRCRRWRPRTRRWRAAAWWPRRRARRRRGCSGGRRRVPVERSRLHAPAAAAAVDGGGGGAAARSTAALERCSRPSGAREYELKLAAINAKYPPAPRATVKDFVDHIDYAVKLIGIDHVGISSDFDGGGGVDGWNSAAETFNVTLELVRRGYTEEQIGKIWSGNLLRVWGEVEQVAKGIQAGDDQVSGRRSSRLLRVRR